MKKLTAVIMALMMITMMLFAVPVLAEESEELFAEWNPEAPALKALIEYVETVTNEESPDYIPPVDRIAV